MLAEVWIYVLLVSILLQNILHAGSSEGQNMEEKFKGIVHQNIYYFVINFASCHSRRYSEKIQKIF